MNRIEEINTKISNVHHVYTYKAVTFCTPTKDDKVNPKFTNTI